MKITKNSGISSMICRCVLSIVGVAIISVEASRVPM
jgi:hypothetical protein